ncbi:protein FAM234A isoform X1 [Petromyzon marinus]|uniref:protein FAM234A isoform X1 n=2 Tax=Petromyzon marinus TaxID=7757 RepID=UPI003F7060F1
MRSSQNGRCVEQGTEASGLRTSAISKQGRGSGEYDPLAQVDSQESGDEEEDEEEDQDERIEGAAKQSRGNSKTNGSAVPRAMDTFNNNQQPLQTQAASVKDNDAAAKGPALDTASNVELRPLRSDEADANGPGDLQNPRQQQSGATRGDAENARGTADGKGPARNESRSGRMRTAAFIVALFVCVLSVLVFAFFIPCPVVMPPRAAWEVELPAHAETATALAMLRVNKDPTTDVIVMYRTLNGSGDAAARCVKAGFASGCTEVMAVSGVDGARLWRRPLHGRPSSLRCDGKHGGSKSEKGRCLLSGEIGPLRSVVADNGKDIWEAWTGAEDEAPRVLTPPLEVGDLDGDTTPDVLFWVAPSLTLSQNGSFLLLSGSSGKPIGSAVSHAIAPGEKPLPLRLLFTAHGAAFVLIASGWEVQALPLADIYLRAVSTASHSTVAPTLRTHAATWAGMADNLTGIVLVHRSSLGPIEAVVPIPVGAWRGHPALLVAAAGNVRLLNASGLETLWEVSVSRLLSLPVYGFFNNDSIPDILVEHELGQGLMQVSVLDGLSGSALWTAVLGASGSRAAGVSVLSVVGGGRDAFAFWGRGAPADSANGSGPAAQSPVHQLYLLHGEIAHLLIPLANSSGPVEGHAATLWDKEKDIGYAFVAAPSGGGGDGSDGDPPGALLRHFRFSDAFAAHAEPVPVPGMRGQPGTEAGEGLQEWLGHLQFQAVRGDDVM